MYRFLAKPKWIAFHILIIGLVVLMVNLGFWQLHRLQSKRAFNAAVTANASQAVAPFASVVTPDVKPSDVEWRNISLTGTYATTGQVTVINLSQGGEVGKDVVTPLTLSDGSLVLVNRGFLPDAAAVPPAPTGQVTIIGQLRTSQERGFGQISDPATGPLTEVHRIDVPLLAQQLSAPVAPLYVNMIRSIPADSSALALVPAPELSEGPHLSYMLQWWFFSLCAIAGWVLAVRRSARNGQLSEADEPAAADSPASV